MKLEIGKTYKNGKGQKIKIIDYEFFFNDWYYRGSDGHYYFSDGTYTVGIKELALVEEVGVVVGDTAGASVVQIDALVKKQVKSAMVDFKVDNSEFYHNLKNLVDTMQKKDSRVDAAVDCIKEELRFIESEMPGMMEDFFQREDDKILNSRSADIIQLKEIAA